MPCRFFDALPGWGSEPLQDLPKNTPTKSFAGKHQETTATFPPWNARNQRAQVVRSLRELLAAEGRAGECRVQVERLQEQPKGKRHGPPFWHFCWGERTMGWPNLLRSTQIWCCVVFGGILVGIG